MNIVDIKTIVKGLMTGFPTVRYVAFNAKLTIVNEKTWKDDWYAVGFVDPPVIEMIAGYPTWVADENIQTGNLEHGVFFIHFKSTGIYSNGKPLQTSPSEFLNEKELCFTLDENNDIVNYYEKD